MTARAQGDAAPSRHAGRVTVTDLAVASPGPSLVLSLFPGVDLFGCGFELEGFSVVRGPDLIFGGDVRAFNVPRGRFDGVIGGAPCQDFSRARRAPPSGDGVAMLIEFCRIVHQTRPSWWLLENVAGVPDVMVPGYSHLRIDLAARDCGARQIRSRVFQWGHRAGLVPMVTRRPRAAVDPSRCCMASEASRPGRRGFPEFCELQGLPRDFDLPGFTLSAKYRAVGNGVHVLAARTMAAAVRDARALVGGEKLCQCGCGRIISQRHRLMATVACRQRVSRANRGVTARDVTNARWSRLERSSASDSPRVTGSGPVTAVASLLGPARGRGD